LSVIVFPGSDAVSGLEVQRTRWLPDVSGIEALRRSVDGLLSVGGADFDLYRVATFRVTVFDPISGCRRHAPLLLHREKC